MRPRSCSDLQKQVIIASIDIMKLVTTLLVLAANRVAVESHSSVGRFSWSCNNSQCRRISSEAGYPTIELCRLVCGEYGALWPTPYQMEMPQRNIFKFNPLYMTIDVNPIPLNDITKEVIKNFKKNLRREYNNCLSYDDKVVKIDITILTQLNQLHWNIDESYDLKISSENDERTDVSIFGNNIFGVRHALETLSQLITSYPEGVNTSCLAMIKEVEISDKPVYTHRGLLLDTARNYLPINNIKKHIQAMAASKMNYLHWHITDSQSFPMETPRVPNMTVYGAYSLEKIYKYDDIKALNKYALSRGVKIIFELDAPAHAGFGWQWSSKAGLGNLTVCLNYQPWRKACIEPPCGQLNPANPMVYGVLEKIYKDIVQINLSNEIFHMGGDEVFISCWNSSDEILKYIKNKARTMETFLDLWAEFQRKALGEYDHAIGHKKSSIILWTSHLTDPKIIEKYLDKNRYVIQTWVPNTDDLPNQLLQKGYKLIISTKNAWYLDHGFWSNTKYYDWRTVYNNRISRDKKVLGGEVCMWTEYVDENGVISRTWPRAAAAAERLWSDTELPSSEVEARFLRHRERLITRGIQADAVTSKWCYYNEGQC